MEIAIEFSEWRYCDRYFFERRYRGDCYFYEWRLRSKLAIKDIAINIFAEDIAINFFAKDNIAIGISAKEDIVIDTFLIECCDQI